MAEKNKKIMFVKLALVGSGDESLNVMTLVCAEDTLAIEQSLARCVTEIVREEIPLEIRYLVEFEVVKKRDAFGGIEDLRVGKSDGDFTLLSCRLPNFESAKDWEIALGRLKGSDGGTPCYFARLETGIYSII